MPEVKHVLVAEDNPAMLGVVRFALEMAGLKVTTAANGQMAWDLLGENDDVDLVVTDFQMPGMTGGQLCENIRKDPRLSQIPVILLTAKGLELDIARFRDELSVSAIVSKPFSPAELTQTVQDCLAVGAANT